MTGYVKTLPVDKPFGFIMGDDRNEYFFHRTGMAVGVEFETIKKGERVKFEPTDAEKGLRAEDVERE